MFAALQRQNGALGEVALAGLSGVEQAQLKGLLERVRANLEAGTRVGDRAEGDRVGSDDAKQA